MFKIFTIVPAVALLAASFVGCTSTTEPTDAGADSGMTIVDAGRPDSGARPDAQPVDSGSSPDAEPMIDGSAADSGAHCVNNADCDDGDFCNGEEVCTAGGPGDGCGPPLARQCTGAAFACDEAAKACVPGFLGQAVEYFDPSQTFDALGYELELRLTDATPGSETYSATVTIVLKNNGPAASMLSLDLDPRNTVTAVAVDGVVATSSHAPGADHRGHLAVVLPAIAHDKAFAVRVAYHGSVNQIVGAPGETVAGFVSARTGASTGEQRIFSTLAWPANTRWWIPSLDHPRDGAMFSGTFTFPAAYQVVSNGRLESAITNLDGTTTTKYVARTPMPPYDFHFAAFDHWTPFMSRTGTTGVRAELLAYSQEAAPLVLGTMPASHDFMVDSYGAFVWDRLGVAEMPSSFGGMEHASVISLSENTFDFALPTAPAGPRSDALLTLAHEDAHHWAGNMVRLKSWNDFWLSEAFAEYMSRRYLEETSPRDALAVWQRSLRIALRNAEGGMITLSPVRPADPEIEPDTLFGSLPTNTFYKKGSLVLRMLEHRIGRPAFTTLVREWFDDHTFMAAGTADFLAHVNAATGSDYTAFFNDWVYGEFHPELDVSYTYESASGMVAVRVQQVQTLGPAAGFSFPLEIDFSAADGTTQRVTLAVSGRDVTLRAALPFAPTAMLLDPDVYLYFAQVCDASAPSPCRAGYTCDATAGRTVRSVCAPGPMAAYPVP